MATKEFNFDGLVGPTHNYAGLSHGNVASTKHQHSVSSPRSAALQGLKKMKFIRDLGVEQCVLPPLLRPNLNFLRQIGFDGTDIQLIEKAHQVDPVLLAICYSASNMWTANAATVSPASDCQDGRLHLTPANLTSNLHRALEAADTTQILRAIFADEQSFEVHDPLPCTSAMSDEGAANHTRLGASWDEAGLELFVYGCEYMNASSPRPARFPARQTLESCQAIARRHGLSHEMSMFIQQNPDAIDAGVFHNDVISVGHQNVLLCHELSFRDQLETLAKLHDLYARHFQDKLHVICLSNEELPIESAVTSYLFNSQLVTRPNGSMALVCPSECETNSSANRATEKIKQSDNRIDEVFFLDLRQSMNNGGGPACLRLRIVLNDRQQQCFHQAVRLTDELYDQLVAWVQDNYRDTLSPADLLDPDLIEETRTASQQLANILSLS